MSKHSTHEFDINAAFEQLMNSIGLLPTDTGGKGASRLGMGQKQTWSDRREIEGLINCGTSPSSANYS